MHQLIGRFPHYLQNLLKIPGSSFNPALNDPPRGELDPAKSWPFKRKGEKKKHQSPLNTVYPKKGVSELSIKIGMVSI